MRLVVDASIVLPLIGFDTPEAAELRDWVDQLLDGDSAHIIRNLTPLEVTSALRRLEAGGEIDPDHATTVQRRIFGWPFVREEITQPLLERVWELRHNFTPYDAAYIAATEALQAQHMEEVALVTADRKIAGAPPATLPVRVITFDQ